ncbi:Isovaleryl-homoserine lactone synthase [Rhodobacteraceae bacterium THAF1]|uniref:acyl-homoserine-lactone synthase n=1 Tax=Palleronia sp. THAF1 TaxID=2587842 RepID=UPI000F3CA58C|nr:acyl-homoserine-lactone synthase [Palleronia sp. THAF1]QFU07871.1 Isovaleryl-homoserine lactone synthase [Palleronia sp. THAF1]VDC25705.1 Isovaleryl-homoserine lactone synthase [Rhodobacteraceae bacterium THAF1]
MIHIFDGAEINRRPALRDDMFRDRATQFVERNGWNINVDASGREIDQYDPLGPTYIVSADGDRHLGSLRLLPTTGRTMLAEIFPDIAPPNMARPGWVECTRYCIAPGAPRHVSAALFLATLELGLQRGWHGSLGVYDLRMMRIYARLGTPGRMLGQRGTGRDAICVGEWRFLPHLVDVLARRAGDERIMRAA